jgi:LacI family transcriptional regulator
MARRPTITDVAKAAGVSVATVDRVLNGRAPVREETTRRVYEAARGIGYHAAALIGQRMQAEMPEVRLGFVLHKERQAFYQAFRQELEAAVAAAPGIRGRATIEFAQSQTPADFAGLIRTLARTCHAVAASAVMHPVITETVATVQEAGVPCFAILNDFAQGIRRNYVGLNNLKTGRIAAHMIATAVHRPGKTAVFVGGYRWHGHELRETGFRSYLREYAPQFTVLDTLVNLETRQLTYEATLDLLSRHPDLRGIYCAGGWHGRGHRRAPGGAGAGGGGARRERDHAREPGGACRPLRRHGDRHAARTAVPGPRRAHGVGGAGRGGATAGAAFPAAGPLPAGVRVMMEFYRPV